MSGLCRDCRFWAPEEGTNDGECALHSTGTALNLKKSKTGICPEAGANDAWFYTDHDFGCNQWEER